MKVLHTADWLNILRAITDFLTSLLGAFKRRNDAEDEAR